MLQASTGTGLRLGRFAVSWERMKDSLRYEIAESRGYPGEWRAEAIGSDREVYVVIFSGPDAKERAAEYAEWKNARRSTAVLELVGR